MYIYIYIQTPMTKLVVCRLWIVAVASAGGGLSLLRHSRTDTVQMNPSATYACEYIYI